MCPCTTLSDVMTAPELHQTSSRFTCGGAVPGRNLVAPAFAFWDRIRRMSDWKKREERAAADLGMTRDEYRKLLITRIWPYWVIGAGRPLRKRLAERQGGHCAMYHRKTCRREFTTGEVREVHHIRPKMKF